MSALLARAADRLPANKNVKWASVRIFGTLFPRVPFTDILDMMRDTGFIGIRLTQFPQILTTYNITADQMRAEVAKRHLQVITVSFNGAPADDPAQHEAVMTSRQSGDGLSARRSAPTTWSSSPRSRGQIRRATFEIACKFLIVSAICQ